MRYRVPGNFRSAENAYNAIEMRGGSDYKRGGQYPIGSNHCWHSGVHIPENNEENKDDKDLSVRPMVRGTIVACRLSRSFSAIPRLSQILKEDWGRLDDNEKFLYKEPQGRITESSIYTLQYESLDDVALDRLAEENPGNPDIRSFFEKKDDFYEPIERVASEYVLMKHELILPLEDNKRQSVNFFALYMGINTLIPELKKYYGEGFHTVGADDPVGKFKLPIFQKWVFRLRLPQNATPKRYRDLSSGDSASFRVFEGSTFLFDGEDVFNPTNTHYGGIFLNDLKKEKVEIPYAHSTRAVFKYRPNKPNVSISKISKRGLATGTNAAILSENASFTKIDILDGSTQYYKIIVWRNDIISSESLTGWVTRTSQQREKSLTYFSLETGQFVYDIRKLDRMPDGYFAMTLGKYYSGENRKIHGELIQSPVQETISNSERPVVVARSGMSDNQNVQHIFYYNGEKIRVLELDSDKFNELSPKSDIARQGQSTDILEIYVKMRRIVDAPWSEEFAFEQGDYVELQENKQGEDIPDYVKTAERLSYCRFSYPSSGGVYNALVRGEDLAADGLGVLKSSFFEGSEVGLIPGCILYDPIELRRNGIERGNAHACLDKDASFEFGDPYPFLEKLQNNDTGAGEFLVAYGDHKGYLHIDRGVSAEARIEFKEDFGDLSSICTPDIEVSSYDILGYPARIRQNYPFYDLALFFENKDFLSINYVGAKDTDDTTGVDTTGDTEDTTEDTKNTVALEQFFIVMEKSGDEGSIYCDHDLVAQAAAGRRMRFEELIGVYKSDSAESLRIKGNLRKIVCQHHLEWNKSLFNNAFFARKRIFNDKRTHFLEKVGKRNLWTNPDGSEAEGTRLPPKGQVWFAHPVYFMQQIDEQGLLDRSFNPYKGTHKTTDGTSFTCNDSPGFATVVKNNTDGIEHDGKFYGRPTGVFNQKYRSDTRGEYHHEGVDFRGSGADLDKDKKVILENGIPKNAAPISSLIYGKVINCGWVNRGIGRILVVANTQGKGIYILAHLSGFAQGITRHSIIEPGETVAYVGGSGFDTKKNILSEIIWHAHLHLEYYDVQYEASRDVDEGANNRYVQVEGTGADRRLILQTALILRGGNRRNPFDHEETQR